MTILPFHGENVKLVWERGEEAICPKCRRRNACLATMWIGPVTIYECRDCHTMYTVDWDKRSEYSSDVTTRNARVIGRSLGKSCYECHSFDLKQVDDTYRAGYEKLFVEGGNGDKFDAARYCPTHICQNCGKEHRY